MLLKVRGVVRETILYADKVGYIIFFSVNKRQEVWRHVFVKKKVVLSQNDADYFRTERRKIKNKPWIQNIDKRTKDVILCGQVG